MLNCFRRAAKRCDGLSRRDVLQVGTLAFTGITLADGLRLQAATSSSAGRPKAVIMIWLRGGASHLDSYDMKPHAPREIRGEFQPIFTTVPGMQICEHMPRQAQIADKFSIIRGIKSVDIGDHTPHFILTGFPDRGKRPVFGAVVSRFRPHTQSLPPYVSLMYEPPGLYDNEGPTYVGPSHRPFVPRDEGLNNLGLAKGMSLDRLQDRRQLLREFDTWQREIDHPAMAGIDGHTAQALQMVSSPRVRKAFDLSQESAEMRQRYGKFCESFLMARRLVEAGVSVVTAKVGDWDTHEKNFIDHRTQLPQLDQGLHALITDLQERGLEQDVAVVVWGEFGRAPHISRGDGRDHWPEAGAAVIAGGGFQHGQVIGATDAHGGQSLGKPYTPSNVLATFYRHLGIDPSETIPDFAHRPLHILDDRQPIHELING